MASIGQLVLVFTGLGSNWMTCSIWLILDDLCEAAVSYVGLGSACDPGDSGLMPR